MPLVSAGNLWDRIRKKEEQHYEEVVAQRTIAKLLDGLMYLHSIGIVHRDLKAENIFMSDPDDDTSIILGKKKNHFLFFCFFQN